MRVADDLKPHNRETIRRILDFFKIERKCCAIQATGTGKTFLILRLLEILNDEGKIAVIFAPNNEIIRQTKKRMKRFGLNNATFYTYQKLARMTEDEIAEIKVDLIVCDELHRTGAKTWGQKFEKLVDLHPESKVFGVTATHLRCADGRDMAEEYFDGNKACDISLAEALVREIIPIMPTYISALYTFEEEYQNMSDKISKANNSDNEKVELQKELLAAKQQLEKANGVPEIIKKYITNYNGKYIVFCKDIKHLYAMKDVVIGWFRESGYDGEIFEYPYYSNNSKVKKNLDDFENNEEDGLKLLFVIDKLNEGLHLDEIDGCILLRTTVSNIIYYQQIGRAIDAGSMNKRVILDLVSNFNSLKSFNLKKELEEKVMERRGGKFSDCSEEFELDKFDVIDCVQECVDIFNKIDSNIENLINEWEEWEDNIVLKYYQIEGRDICERLPHRSWNAIKARAYILRVQTKGGEKWTDEEDQKFTQLYLTYGSDAYNMMPKRSYKSCATRSQRLNLSELRKNLNSTRTIFSKEEDKIIEEKYPEMGTECQIYMKSKTKEQIKSRAGFLGIKKKSKSKYKYVQYISRINMWHVGFKFNGKNYSFGYYHDEDEAGKIAMEKAKEYGKAA